MKILTRKILLALAPPLIFLLIKILYFSCKIKYKIPKKTSDLITSNQNFIIAFWHGKLLMQPCLFSKLLKKKQRKTYVLISQHFDGDIISQTMRYFKIDSLRGSSSKGNVKVLLSSIRKLQENNFVAITPDGPRGPYHSIADGIIVLSQKSKKPIVISQIIYHNAWRLKSWDKFEIPKPFSKITYVLKEPLWVKDLDLENAKKYIHNQMES